MIEETGSYKTMKEIIGLMMEPLKAEVSSLSKALDRVTVSSPTPGQFDQIRYQVSELSEMSKAISEEFKRLETRLERLENHDSIGMWFFKIVVTVCTALLIGWLTGLLKV